MAWFERPFTSARRREIGAASSRRLAVIASRICTVLSSTTRRRYRPHRMEARELDYDLPPELIAQHPADAPRRVAAARLRPRRPARCGTASSATCRELLPRDALAVVNDTRVVPARIPIERAARRGAAARARRTATSGRRSRGRRGACAPGGDYGPGRAARAPRRGALAGPARRRAGRRRRRCRRTSRSRSPTRSATRRSTRASRARRPRRRPACTSRRSCWRDSTSSASPCTSVSTRSARCRPRRRRGAPHPRRALRGAATHAWRADRRGARACSPSARRRCASLETLARGGPLAGRTELFITPGLRVRAASTTC